MPEVPILMRVLRIQISLEKLLHCPSAKRNLRFLATAHLNRGFLIKYCSHFHLPTVNVDVHPEQPTD
jgi:hypothetical protein